jgi:hypothetical protein
MSDKGNRGDISSRDAARILSMLARGDRPHDVAAWFGVNQGRIAEIEDGEFGLAKEIDLKTLPPRGSPGQKARRLMASLEEIEDLLRTKGEDGIRDALAEIEAAKMKYRKAE